jgi:hypothetical protein
MISSVLIKYFVYRIEAFMKRLFTIIFVLAAFMLTSFQLQIHAELAALSYSYLSMKQTDNSASNSFLKLLDVRYGKVSEIVDRDIPLSDENTIGNNFIVSAQSVVARLETTPLFFPGSFKISNGANLGYRLSKDMDIEIRIYNIRGNMVSSEMYPAGSEGGEGGLLNNAYNKVEFNSTNLGDLPAGIYFFVIINEGKVLGKGKFAILP